MKTVKSIMMNLAFFTLILSFYITTAFSQSIVFPMENAEWKYTIAEYSNVIEQLTFSPDTVMNINGKDYARLSDINLIHPTISFDKLYYREDEGKVYVLPQDSINELLLYDFTLEVGDKFYPTWGTGLFSDTIILELISKENVILENGVEAVKFVFDDEFTYIPIVWWEGIGDQDRPFFYPAYNVLSHTPFFYSLSCHFSQEDDYIFDEGSCPISTNTKNRLNQELNIYPNPAMESISVESSIKITQISLVNQYGIIQQNINCNSNFCFMEFSDVKSGLYILKIEREGKVEMKKIFVL